MVVNRKNPSKNLEHIVIDGAKFETVQSFSYLRSLVIMISQRKKVEGYKMPIEAIMGYKHNLNQDCFPVKQNVD